MNGRELVEADALRAFASFAAHRNFTRAAAELHLSQPSLHVKIGKLGAALGVELYERVGRELRLTPAGERLAAFALDSRHRVDEFLAELHDVSPTLALAAGRGAVRWVLAEAIRDAPAGVLRLVTAGRDDALAALTAGTVDLAVVAHDPPWPGLEQRELASYPQVLAVAAGHPLAGRGSVLAADLDGLDLVVPPTDRPHRRALDRALLAAGATARVRAEADGWDLLVHLASLGLGATVVNGCVGLPPGLVSVPVDDLPAVRYWAAWRPSRRARVAALVERMARGA